MKEFSPFKLDPGDQSLWRGDQRIHLTPKAFAVLQYLVDRAGRLVTQTELLEALWPDTFVQPEVLKSQILDIRTALGDRVKDPLFIETVPRRGYRFIAPVREGALDAQGELPTERKVVGRDRPLEELRGALKRASAGERQIVFVTGEQGMGKTTLVETFLHSVSGTGIAVATGQCLEGYGSIQEPYYPVLEAVGRLAQGELKPALTRVLETYAPTWLIQMPALLTREHRDTLQRELAGATRERMLREICEALERLTAETTLVLLFEDLHWTDAATVDLLGALAHRRSAAKMLVIGTYRPVDVVLAQHPLKQAAHSLKAHRLSREIALSPLATPDVQEYLARQAGADTGGDDVHRLAGWIARQTEGNPLFMVTVIEHLLELGHIQVLDGGWNVARPLDQIEVEVPDTLRQMIEMQIERLSPREQLTLDAASVHGLVFSSAVTAATLEIDPEDVEDTCRKLAQQHHMVRQGPVEQLPDGRHSQRYEFVHAAFRSVFYHRLAPARRAKLHRRFGEAIEIMFPEDRAPVAAELASHFQECADWNRAAEYLWLAAQNAWKRLAYREALSILGQALAAAERLAGNQRLQLEVRLLERIAVLQHALHDAASAMSTLERLADAASTAGNAEVESRALSLLSGMKAGENALLCTPLLDRLGALAAKQEQPLVRAQVRALHAAHRISLSGWDDGIAAEHAADLELVRQSGDRLAYLSILTDYSYQEWLSSRYAASLDHVQEGLPAMLASGRLVRYLQGRDLMAVNLGLLGQWGRALDVLDESIEEAQRNEAPFRLVMPMVFKAWVHLNAMDFDGVAQICQQTLPSLGSPFLRARKLIALQVAASATLGRGEVQPARIQLRDLREELAARPVVLGWYWGVPVQLGLTEASIGVGDLAQARIEADLAVGAASATAERTWHGLAWEASARVALLAGDSARAATDSAHALQAIRGFEVPLAAWRVHATAAAISGDPEQGAAARKVLLRLARSLESRPAMHANFLSSPTVAGVLGGAQSASMGRS